VLRDVTVSVVDGANAGKSATTGLDGQYVLSGLVRDAFRLRVSTRRRSRTAAARRRSSS